MRWGGGGRRKRLLRDLMGKERRGIRPVAKAVRVRVSGSSQSER